jgi:putative heme iron utilization protein
VESETAVTKVKTTLRVPHDEMAKSIVHLANSGTLATVMEDGWPLATQMKYVLDAQGRPVLKLRVDAIHTNNLQREARCSLYVRSSSGARASMLGTVEPLQEGEETDMLIAEYAAVHGESAFGVDALAVDDVYCTLAIQKIFFVEGLGVDKTAAEVPAEAYFNATVDPICEVAPNLIKWMNNEYADQIQRCAEVFAGLDNVVSAEMLWVDSLGCDIRAKLSDAAPVEIRLPFVRRVEDERDARSSLTMMGQLAWELQRGYSPVAPELPAEESAEDPASVSCPPDQLGLEEEK